jgi:hypothetical protein
MGEAIAFYTLAAFILGFAVLVVSTKDTVHSVLFLVLDFLFVAALYVLLAAPFLAVIQVLVYAGGSRVVSVRRHAGEPQEAARGAPGPAAPLEAGARPIGRRAARTDGHRRDRGLRDRAPGHRRGAGDADAGQRQHRTGWLAVVHELLDSLRNRLDAAARRDDWSDRAGEEGTGSQHYPFLLRRCS